jgi:hypothetical protein
VSTAIRRHTESLISFSKSNLGKQFLFYFFFYAVMWVFHIILISLVSFFHLLLDHNIRTIGDWIGDRGWSLIIISKLFVFYLAIQFINLKTNKIFSIKSYFRNNIQTPRLEVFVALIFLIIGLMGIGDIRFNSTMIFELDRILLSFLGTFVFFAVDYILLVILDVFFPVRDEVLRNRRLFLLPFLFYLFSAATFMYEQTISLNFYAFFLLLVYSGEWRRKNWTLPAVFLVSFLIPCFTFLGLDPVWGEIYSPFFASKKISTPSIFILVGFAVLYLHYTLKKKPEYIYRD